MEIALLGYGRMGKVVEAVAEERGHRIVQRVGAGDGDAALDADVAIDFSVAGAVPENAARAVRAGVSLVVGTTGWEEREDEVRRAVEEGGIGFLHAPNFSLGAHLFYRLAELAGSLVGVYGDYDVDLSETHHRHKRDHPSGTARRLADLLVATVATKERWVEGPVSPDEPATLGVTSIRVGEARGTHVVELDGPDDRIEMRHEARSRKGFARGAMEAAEWLAGRAGWFTLDDMLTERLDPAPESTGAQVRADTESTETDR